VASAAPAGHLDSKFLDRVRRVYRRLVSAETGNRGGHWTKFNAIQRNVHDALLSDQPDDLRRIFADPLSSDLFYGVDNLSASILGKSFDDPGTGTALSEDARRVIASFAAALDIRDDPEAVLTALDHLLSQKVVFPAPFRGELGLSTTRGIASHRAIQSLYQTWRAKKLLRQGSILEIGPGMGRGAFYAFRAGFTDYATVDIPLGVVRQACFLGAVLGPDLLWFDGEDPAHRDGRISVLGAGNLPDRCFDLAINVDSMTEMSRSSAATYLRWMNGYTKMFLSINHENNAFTVGNLARSALNFNDRRKAPCPVRPGYVEEVFVIGGRTDIAVRLLGVLQEAAQGTRYWFRRLIERYLP
jgi:hypothetical protein